VKSCWAKFCGPESQVVISGDLLAIQ
jgi:hypothetical protein